RHRERDSSVIENRVGRYGPSIRNRLIRNVEFTDLVKLDTGIGLDVKADQRANCAHLCLVEQKWRHIRGADLIISNGKWRLRSERSRLSKSLDGSQELIRIVIC